MGPIDLYDPQVTQALPVSLGRFDLEPGTHTFSIEITGTNPKAVPASMAGLDCLYLIPVAEEPVASSAAVAPQTLSRVAPKETRLPQQTPLPTAPPLPENASTASCRRWSRR